MKRDLHFPTPIYHFDIKDQSKDIEAEWVKESYGGTDPD